MNQDEVRLHKPPITIQQDGPEKLAVWARAERAVVLAGLLLTPLCALGIWWSLQVPARQSMTELQFGVLIFSLLVGLALLFFCSGGRRTVLDFGQRVARQTVYFHWLPIPGFGLALSRDTVASFEERIWKDREQGETHQCRTGYHAECTEELGHCATLGCRHHERRPERVAERA